MSKRIEILARGVTIHRARLLVCRNRKTGNVFLPGGHIEFGESARDALRREIVEEIGSRSKVGRFLGAVEHIFVYRRKRYCELNLVFKLEIPGISSTDAVPSMEPKLEFAWLNIADLKKTSLNPAVLRTLLPLWLEDKQSRELWGSTY